MLICCSFFIFCTAKLSRISYQRSPWKFSSHDIAIFEISGKIISFIFNCENSRSLVCDSQAGNIIRGQKNAWAVLELNHWLGWIWIFQKRGRTSRIRRSISWMLVWRGFVNGLVHRTCDSWWLFLTIFGWQWKTNFAKNSKNCPTLEYIENNFQKFHSEISPTPTRLKIGA